jgi:FkbM family methyltransferase
MSLFRRQRPDVPDDDRATEADVYAAYRMILKRNPDPSGLAHYKHLVSEGVSIDRLSRSFLDSDEFRWREQDETTPTPIDLGGYQVCVQKRDTDFAQAMFHTHQYEEHVRQAVREYLHPGDVVVDVGANVGVITLLAASIVGPAGRVVAVEPNPDNLQLLYRGIVLNGFENVEVVAAAASDRRRIFSLTGGTSNTHLIGARAPVEGGFFVQSLVLDEALGDMPRLDLVKMDIEGHEPRALAGMARLVGRHRPTLLVEFNPRCLVDLQAETPLAFLRQIFALYPRVRVTSAFSDDRVFERAEAVMDYWEQRNREVTAARQLPDRLLHFDLIATQPVRRTP